MSALILRHNWTRQPQAPVGINWDHQLARELCFFILPVGGCGVDLVSGAVGQRGATATVGTTKAGRAIGSTATAGVGWSFDFKRNVFLKTDPGITLLAGSVCNVVNTTRKNYIRFINVSTGVGTFLMEYGGDSLPYRRFIATTSQPLYPIAAVDDSVAGAYYSSGFSKQRTSSLNTGWALSTNGKSTTATTLTTGSVANLDWYDNLSGVTIGGSSSLGFDGLVSYATAFRAALSQDALNSLTANPWQLLRPMSRRLWVGVEAVANTDALTASPLTVSSPVLGTPAIGQTHALTASGITVEGPVLGAPTLAQIHALVASGLTVSAPVLGTPTLTENLEDVDVLFAENLVVGSPVLGTPALGQVHSLTAAGLVVGSPVLGTPVLDDGTAQPVTDRQTIGTISGGTVYPIEADDEVILVVIRKFLEVVDAQLG